MKKPLSDGLFIVPLQMAEARKLKDALSEMLHGAVIPSLFKQKAFGFALKFIPVVWAGESHLLWQEHPQARCAGCCSRCALGSE